MWKLYKWGTPVLKYQMIIVSPGACPVIPIPTSLSVPPPAASDIPRTHMELSYYYYQVLFSLTTSEVSNFEPRTPDWVIRFMLVVPYVLPRSSVQQGSPVARFSTQESFHLCLCCILQVPPWPSMTTLLDLGWAESTGCIFCKITRSFCPWTDEIFRIWICLV